MSADSAISYHGVYINLDRSPARRSEVDLLRREAGALYEPAEFG